MTTPIEKTPGQIEIGNLVNATVREMTTGSAYDTSNDGTLGFRTRHRFLTALAQAVATAVRAPLVEEIEKLKERIELDAKTLENLGQISRHNWNELTALRSQLEVARTALVEVRDHLFNKQDMARCRELAKAALSIIPKESA